ncbi:MAG TPA: hypothetical protein VF230_15900 [Acidimicrobiales bacterium]
METRRWVNQSQPQTLQIGVILLYLTAAFVLLFDQLPEGYFVLPRDFWLPLRFIVPAAGVGAAYGIANEQKWGWYLGVAVAGIPLALLLYYCVRNQVNPLDFQLISLMFDIALFVLLVHPMSRNYQKIWFK